MTFHNILWVTSFSRSWCFFAMLTEKKKGAIYLHQYKLFTWNFVVLLVVRVGALDLGRQILNRRSKEVVPEKGKIWTLSKHLTINFTQTHTSKHIHTFILTNNRTDVTNSSPESEIEILVIDVVLRLDAELAEEGLHRLGLNLLNRYLTPLQKICHHVWTYSVFSNPCFL